MQFLVLQHLDIEPPAMIGEILLEAGHTLLSIHTYLGEACPRMYHPIPASSSWAARNRPTTTTFPISGMN